MVQLFDPVSGFKVASELPNFIHYYGQFLARFPLQPKIRDTYAYTMSKYFRLSTITRIPICFDERFIMADKRAIQALEKEPEI